MDKELKLVLVDSLLNDREIDLEELDYWLLVYLLDYYEKNKEEDYRAVFKTNEMEDLFRDFYNERATKPLSKEDTKSEVAFTLTYLNNLWLTEGEDDDDGQVFYRLLCIDLKVGQTVYYHIDPDLVKTFLETIGTIS